MYVVGVKGVRGVMRVVAYEKIEVWKGAKMTERGLGM